MRARNPFSFTLMQKTPGGGGVAVAEVTQVRSTAAPMSARSLRLRNLFFEFGEEIERVDRFELIEIRGV